MKWLPKFRFSMRTLFIIVTLLCVLLVPLSVKLYQARQQRLAVEWLLANGGGVKYDHQVDAERAMIFLASPPTDNRWLRRVFGNDFFDAVVEVSITNPNVTDISQLTHLRSIENVFLNNPQNVDLSPLESLKTLDSLSINFSSKKSFTLKNMAELSKLNCPLTVILEGKLIDDLTPIQPLSNIHNLLIEEPQVTDLTPLIHLDQLESLCISFTPVKDISALSNLSRLKDLGLCGTQVNDFSPLSNLAQLESLTIFAPNTTDIMDLTSLGKLTNLRQLSLLTSKINDLSPLENLVNLEHLTFSNQVSKAEIDKLEKALPNCEVNEYLIF
ncbi:MAG: hypothetical protein COA78_23865 [Blastopirellula sp.]|nr:MAG: hypothetical protein COA78_23865 [Blastopirellula sp.]